MYFYYVVPLSLFNDMQLDGCMLRCLGRNPLARRAYRSSVLPTSGIGGLPHVATKWTLRLLFLQSMLLPARAWCYFRPVEKSTSTKPCCLNTVAVWIFNRHLCPSRAFPDNHDLDASVSLPFPLWSCIDWFASPWCSTPVINSLFLEYGAYLHAYFCI